MKLDRTKNSIKGIKSGIINKIIVLILPFIVRTIFIKKLGIEYLGLNSLFTSLLNVLNLAELGVGSAIVFSLYRAIARNDTDEINALVNYYKKVYKIIGIIVCLIGIIFIPFIRIFCNNDIPSNINIYYIYILYLINSVSSYFLFAYKNSILVAFQQNYIINNVNTFIKILLNILQIMFLMLGRSYYIYVILIIFSTILENLVNAIIVQKKYPQYIPKGELKDTTKQNILKKVKALFLYKIGNIVLTSVDSIVISSFLGLSILGKYNNYYYVITALFGFFQVYYNALLAGIGNSIASETVNKNYKDFKKLNFIQNWTVGFSTICLVCLYQPFIKIWIGPMGILDIKIVILLAIYFYTWKTMDIINLYKEAAGIWEYDKYRPIVASVINLCLNIILVKIIGIYGIVLSTIISIIFVILPWSSYILYKVYFKHGYKSFWKEYIINIFNTTIICIITYGICNFIKDDFFGFLFKILLCTIIPNILYFLFYCKTKMFKSTLIWIYNKLSKK